MLFDQILNHREVSALPSLVESGKLPALVSGLSQVHRNNLAAALYRRLERPMLVLCPDDTSAESIAADLRSMLGREPAVLLSREFIFAPAQAVSRQGEHRRIEALHRLQESSEKEACPILVASMTGLLQRTMPPEVLDEAVLTVENGKEYNPEQLENGLLKNGYVRTDQVEGPGQFARRGGILDFFSPGSRQPVRMEFWGDEVDSMGHFDPMDQRRTENLDMCRILPAQETLPGRTAGGLSALCSQLRTFADNTLRRKRGEQAQTLAQNLQRDAERMEHSGTITDADRYLPVIYSFACGLDYVPADAFVMFDRPGRCAELAKLYDKQLGEDVRLLYAKGELAMSADGYALGFTGLLQRLENYPVYMTDAFTVGNCPLPPRTLTSLAAKQLPSYGGSMQAALEDVKLYLKQQFRVVVLAGDERRAGVLQNYFREHDIRALLTPVLKQLPGEGACSISVGSLSAGVEYPELKLVILTDAQMVRTREKKKPKPGRLPHGRQRIESYADLTMGDYVVHENHGIGRFSGIVKMKVDGFEKDYVKIAYAGTDTLYVPATQLDLVTKYTGAGEEKPVKLSKMGGTEWAKTRSRAKGAAKDMAKKLIALYAERQRLPGYAFAPDSEWQQEFEDNFGYTETDDQLRCAAEIKRDMESSVPMDRLLCGDVGFGKTEVALRAVMKCVLDGKQAAILVPTTVLAQQHYQTAVQRFFGYPVNIQVLSRMKTEGQSNEVLRSLACGTCDLVIGTHRLLSKDIHFKDLGLLVVDEEQRFGVSHKEHIKELSRGVDVLTLSATPIPRTLNMALSGIRDMSSIDEPPEDRLPVQTFVMEHNWDMITDAIQREIQRGGQVYYLHNRVEDIERTAKKIAALLENVTVAVAHGKMDKNMLSSVMERVVNGEIQVLVCTTIIETGIDIPNVNTLIIEDADRLGLAQLHQIRGRVGRSSRRASAYLTFRQNKVLSEDAEKRLNAIREYAAFGSGIKIAMRDLEIRGAGNLLGAEQSGHMIDVGYDMYMKLLNEAVLEARGIPVPQRADCSADLVVAANIPERYIPSQEQRMDIYRRMALIRTEEEADDLTDELIDRYGDLPPGVNALIQIAVLRGIAGRAGITDISQKQGYLRFQVKEFNLEKVSDMYARPEYKGRLRVEAGSSPCLSLKIRSKTRVIDEARTFAQDWESKPAEDLQKKTGEEK